MIDSIQQIAVTDINVPSWLLLLFLCSNLIRFSKIPLSAWILTLIVQHPVGTKS